MLNKLLYAVGLLLLLALGYATYDFFSFSQQRNDSVRAQAAETTVQLRDQIDSLLKRVSREGNRVAKLLGDNNYTPDEVRSLLKKSALRLPEIQGVTAAYEPYGLNDKTKLFAPYYNKGTQTFIQCEDTYDYTDAADKRTAWYTKTRDNGEQWVEPYYGTASQEWFVDLGVPVKFASGSNKGEVRGTVTMSFLCRDFGDLIHQLSLGKTGYGLITSQQGKFLAHANPDFVGKTSLSQWLADEQPPAALRDACEALLSGESGLVQFQDKQNKPTLFCYDQIPTSGWGIGMGFLKNDLLGDQVSVNRRYIHIALLGSLLLVCILAIVYSFDYLDESEIWRLSLISSILLLVNIFLIGVLEHRSERPKEANVSHPVTDYASLQQFVNQRHDRSNRLKRERAISIPTGIHIQRMDFQDSYNVNIGGTVWQKAPLDLDDQIKLGVTFPQTSPFAEALLMEDAYRETVDGIEGRDGYLLVGWNFRVTLQLNFAYANFPFDKRQIDIEIAPAETGGGTILVPDLASYRSTTPSTRPGLSDSIVLSGNEITESYFNFSVDKSSTDFGYGPESGRQQAAVLHFNVHLRRKLVNVFVTYLIPIVVALVMIFILLTACRKTTERQGIIESMAAFIFVLIFSHIDLRKEVVTGELIYLEYFYFITYAMVLLSTFNLMAYTLDKTKQFDFNDNQLFKACYFPLFLFAVLIVTLVKFY